MFKNYFKTAWRSLRKSKGYSFINITGLAVGMTVALLIGLWIWDEASFDFYHTNHARLAQVMINQTTGGRTYTGSTVAIPPAAALRAKYGDDFTYVSLVSYNEDHILVSEDTKLSERGAWVQPDFPEMFTLVMLKGRRDALKDPSSVLLTESLAKALFGNADPMNKTLRIDNKLALKVAGVYADLPHNTTFYETKFLLSWDNRENRYSGLTDWDDHSAQLFVQLAGHADAEKVNARIKGLPTPYIKACKEELLLQPLDKVHLYSEYSNGKPAGGRIQFLWLFGIIGVFVLLLACINFMNLSTARSEKRAREVGIRKTLGSLRQQLIGQFLSESVLVALLAFVLALLLAQISLPFFNGLADKQMTIPWNGPLFWLLAAGFTLFTGLVAGSYPALYLSGFNPVKVLKGAFRAGRLASLPRKALVVLQFTVSITLIIGTITVFRQIAFARDRPVGYTREGLISVGMNTPELQGRYDALRGDLLQTGAVDDMAESSYAPTGFNSNNEMDWKGKPPGLTQEFRNVNVTPDFGRTIGWRIVRGRDFSRDFPTDSDAALLNEAAAKVIGFTDPIGQVVTFGEKNYVVIGVVKDMVTQSPYAPIEPAVFFGRGYLDNIMIRVKANMPAREALAKIEPVFRTYNPASPFVYNFIDDAYARKFSEEQRIGKLATFFAVLAIFISCLGLFGLASFVAEQRTREIGVRKVLGASVLQVWGLLSKEFVGLVIVAVLISVPAAWYFMQGWLQHYTYRADMSWWIFAAAGLGALLITLLTVSWQSIRAGLMNPVKSLRAD